MRYQTLPRVTTHSRCPPHSLRTARLPLAQSIFQLSALFQGELERTLPASYLSNGVIRTSLG